MEHLILAIVVGYGDGSTQQLLMLGTWFYEYPYCTDSDILLFLFLLTNVLIVSRFGKKCLLNTLNLNVKDVGSHSGPKFVKGHSMET